MANSRLTIDEVNKIDYEEFIRVFGSVVEHGHLAAATVWACQPFSNVEALCHSFTVFLQQLPDLAKCGIIRCYPDLAGKLTDEKKLSKESMEEHSAAGLLELTREERSEINSLNSSYKAKFSFPFVICARENKKKAIMEGMKCRLDNTVLDEINTALSEIQKICHLRIKDIVH